MKIETGVIDQLKSRNIDVTQQFEFQIPVDHRPISTTELQELTKLPYEIALTEENNKIILTTGGENNMFSGYAYEERRHKSKLSLHTHHEYSDGGDVSAPSFPDVLDSVYVSKNTPLILVNPSGIMMYHAPIYNPLTNKKFRGDVMELIFHYCKGQEEFRREFAVDTRMIVQEVLWSDTAGIQKMMDIVNLTLQSLLREVRG
ncbi:MAG: hypothetical protein NTY06_00355 [Candidatus Gottesmanbacteria bacterium]|nr:hypothetical protein [Candidatus Gottesmanbacteria bacterium]